MLKFLLILIIILYLLYKIGSFFYRAGVASQQFRNGAQDQQRKSQNGQAPRKDAGAGKFKGGEYVDYEEVK